ncbi:response regulator [Methylovulum psychrotolerans]|uniref:Sensory/regulatory protein RpfC n=1 Tax=Methylovulum psychrotolerans TaxID=1704499 RepID=A0A1Z4BYS6_9GAMM|nr:response regulator [Methylovulum psychrotolerans]ASF46457.1 histidine kinase [Methylovulum psychrotolerans]
MIRSKLICVLLVEDDPIAAQRVQVCLRQFKEIPFEVVRAGSAEQAPTKTVDSRARDMRFEIVWVQSLDEALPKLAEFHFDVIVLALSLADSQGLPTLQAFHQQNQALPVIVLLGNDDDPLAQAALKAGAKAHVVKDDAGYEGLVRLIKYVLHRADIETRNQLLIAALKATSNAIIITDRDARIEWINPAFTQLSGYSFQESLGRRPIDLLKSGVHDAIFYQQMWAKLANDEHWQGEIVNRHKDGSLYNADVGISPVFDNAGVLSGYVQIQRDITDSVVLLNVSEVLQKTIPLATRFGQVLLILFNLKAFDLAHKGCVLLRSADDPLALVEFVLSGDLTPAFLDREKRLDHRASLSGQVLQSGEVLVADDCYCSVSDQYQLLDMQAHGHYVVPLVLGNEVLGTLFLFTDCYPLQTESRLTMLKQVGEMMALAVRQEETKVALETARDLAMQASLIKSEFLANMSHEIRTPMNGVLGMLDLLRETKLSPTQQDWVDTACSSAEALLDIINDILDYSKLEAGKCAVEQIEFNLADLVDDICALLAVRAYGKGLELNCALPVPMPLQWLGDPMRIRQVLTNLVGNAVKFTEQGEIYIKVSRTPLTMNQDEVRFEVRDTGIGISLEAQRQLFKPFSQADSATSRRFGGSGLGLSISKRLVELMGGHIGMDSHPGAGTCFWFTLPLTYTQTQETRQLSCDLSGKRTLVVDDNATNREVLANYLASWGLAVSEVDNGSAALMQLQTSALHGIIYDLILLDVQMPIMDGLTLAKCLAHIPTLAAIPIILISSGDQFNSDDYQNTAIVQRLLKPVRQLQLFDVIVNALHCVDAPPTEAAAEPPVPCYRGKNILVVEDNKINQKVITAKLAKFGLVPEIAENGQVALDKLAHQPYDLILMDCQMPVLDGYNATRELRLLEHRQAWPRQTVIALTANALEGEREKCLAAGMDDYLTKPIVSEQLQAVLARTLGGSDDGGVPDPGLAATQAPVWDEARALKQLDGDQELLDEMISLFLEEGAKQLAVLMAAQGQAVAVANAAHTIKGTLGHFCADTAKTAASILENAARSGEVADLSDLVETLKQAVTVLIGQLQNR